MDINSRAEPTSSTNLQTDPNYLTLSRMLTRYQNLILLTPIPDAKLEARLAPWQKKVQAELWSPLPFHRLQWLRSIEGARSLLLKLEQSAQSIKVQRTRREVVRDLAEKRTVIKRLRNRVEEIGRSVEAEGSQKHTFQYVDDEQSETMYDVLQQIRRENGRSQDNVQSPSAEADALEIQTHVQEQGDIREQLLDSSSNIRRRQGKDPDGNAASKGTSSGFANLGGTENALLASSREHEDITTSLVSMAAQLKQQARQFQFTLDQDKGLIDRALEGLDQNVSAMGLASKGMKTLQRMSEEQGWWGRMKLHALIFGLWTAAILLVFVGPKLRF